MTSDIKTNKAIKAARISIYSNSALVVLKLVIGLMIGSVSVISEAIHSGSDLLASFIAFFSLKAARKPADDHHPYGHGKIESISGIIEALLILAAAGYIIYEAVNKLSPTHHEPLTVGPGLVIMFISGVVNIFIGRYLFKVAKETDSIALKADAAHLSADVYTSFGVVVGLGLIWIFKVNWIDPIAAIIVALFICYTAFKLIKESFSPLLDQTLPLDEITQIEDVFKKDDRVLGYHKLRTRKSGHIRHIDAHVLVADQLSLIEAHNLTEELEDKIREQLDSAEITIHTEPYLIEMRHQAKYHSKAP